MKKFFSISLICCACLAQSVSDSLASEPSAPLSNMFFQSEKLSLFSPERLEQKRAFSFSYSSFGGNGLSAMSYLHSFGYTINRGFKTTFAFELSRISSGNSSCLVISPHFRLGWRGNSGASFTIDLKLSPQRISGDFPNGFMQNRLYRR